MVEVKKRYVRMAQRLLPVIPVALSVAAIAFAEQGTNSPIQPPAASQVLVAPSSSPGNSNQTHVMVNGEDVSASTDGSAHIALSASKASTENSDDTTMVNSSSGTNSVRAESHDGKTLVQVDSNSGGGSSWSTTQIYGFNADNGSQSSFSNTSVFSSGSAYVEVSQ